MAEQITQAEIDQFKRRNPAANVAAWLNDRLRLSSRVQAGFVDRRFLDSRMQSMAAREVGQGAKPRSQIKPEHFGGDARLQRLAEKEL